MKKIVFYQNKKKEKKMEQVYDVSMAEDPEHLLELVKKVFQERVETMKIKGNKIVVTISDELNFNEVFPLTQSISSFIRERQALESMEKKGV